MTQKQKQQSAANAAATPASLPAQSGWYTIHHNFRRGGVRFLAGQTLELTDAEAASLAGFTKKTTRPTNNSVTEPQQLQEETA
jgi:hypothetical protein